MFSLGILSCGVHGCSVEKVESQADAQKTMTSTPAATPSSGESKRIQVDGSSTVAKVAAAVAEEFEGKFSDVKAC